MKALSIVFLSNSSFSVKLICYDKKERAAVRPLAAHFVSTLKQKVSKNNPLWAVFSKEIIAPKVLESKAGREAWLAAQTANRKHRFRKVNKKVTCRLLSSVCLSTVI
jgi:hypothetical protein